MMEKQNIIRKGCMAATAALLFGGLTACVNPLTGGFKLAVNSLAGEVETEEQGEIETREWELRKIEPDSQLAEENEEGITNEITDEAVPMESIVQKDLYRKERIAAYASILEGIYYHQMYPNGQKCEFTSLDDLSENQFALYDVDKDGKDELVVQITTTYMAAMSAYIYDWDEAAQVSREEFLEFPALTFYDNGMIKADWSHNQGLAGEFWPYTLYQYQPETDTYQAVGSVDAWDKHFHETDYKGNSFPDDLDRDGNGFIYYIDTDEPDSDALSPVDDDAYQQWLNGHLGNAQEIVLPFKKLTEENIAQLAEK